VEATVQQLASTAAELVRRVRAGEVITITDDGRPVADLVPHHSGAPVANQHDVLRNFASMPPVDPDRLRADLDAVIDPRLDDPYDR
jgi:prevent-host-death family protein